MRRFKSEKLFILVLYSFFNVDTSRYDVALNFDLVTLTFDLWPWTFVVYRLWRDESLYQILAKSSNQRQSYCDFYIWPCDLKRVLHVELKCELIFTKFKLSQPSRSRYVTIFCCWYVILSCDLDFDQLKLNFLVHQFDNLAIFGILHLLPHAVTLTCEPLTLEFYMHFEFHICLNFVQNLTEIE